MSRTRISDNRLYVPYVVADYDDTGSMQFSRENTGTLYGPYKLVTDTVTPRFFDRIKKGEFINNNFSLKKTVMHGSPAEMCIGPHGEWGHREISANFAAHLAPEAIESPWDGDISRIRDDALIKAYAKVDASTISGLANIAELDQTIGMLKRPLGSARKLLSGMIRSRDSKIRKGMAVFKAVSNTWLEYRYGWKPLLMDAESIMSDAVKLANGKQRFVISRSSTKVPIRTFRTFCEKNAIGLNLLYGNLTSIVDVKAHAGVAYVYKNDAALPSTWRKKFGFRSQDIPSAVYEVIPYSFVADWFVGIGDWIKAITPKPNVRFLGSWVTVVDRRTCMIENIIGRLHVGDVKSAPANTYYVSAPNGKLEIDSVVRTTNLPLPTLPVRKIDPISTLHSIDAISLLIQKIIPGLRTFKH